MNWKRVKETLPPLSETTSDKEKPLLAHHTIHEIGFALFFMLEEDDLAMIKKDYPNRKYICSADFIFNHFDGNMFVETESNIDIFDDSPDFINLGTITHWMELPSLPNLTEREKMK
jgi:hypothetical protein